MWEAWSWTRYSSCIKSGVWAFECLFFSLKCKKLRFSHFLEMRKIDATCEKHSQHTSDMKAKRLTGQHSYINEN